MAAAVTERHHFTTEEDRALIAGRRATPPVSYATLAKQLNRNLGSVAHRLMYLGVTAAFGEPRHNGPRQHDASTSRRAIAAPAALPWATRERLMAGR